MEACFSFLFLLLQICQDSRQFVYSTWFGARLHETFASGGHIGWSTMKGQPCTARLSPMLDTKTCCFIQACRFWVLLMKSPVNYWNSTDPTAGVYLIRKGQGIYIPELPWKSTEIPTIIKTSDCDYLGRFIPVCTRWDSMRIFGVDCHSRSTINQGKEEICWICVYY